MKVWPWWVRLALWVIGVSVVDEKPALPPPPYAEPLPPLRDETIRRALAMRARDELTERLWVLDGYLWLALRGSSVKPLDPTVRN